MRRVQTYVDGHAPRVQMKFHGDEPPVWVDEEEPTLCGTFGSICQLTDNGPPPPPEPGKRRKKPAEDDRPYQTHRIGFY